MKIDSTATPGDRLNLERDSETDDFLERVSANQRKLTSELKSHYDFIVCGSGSSGSVVAGRLTENSALSVLLLEAGGDDDVPSVMDATQLVQGEELELARHVKVTEFETITFLCLRISRGIG